MGRIGWNCWGEKNFFNDTNIHGRDHQYRVGGSGFARLHISKRFVNHREPNYSRFYHILSRLFGECEVLDV